MDRARLRSNLWRQANNIHERWRPFVKTNAATAAAAHRIALKNKKTGLILSGFNSMDTEAAALHGHVKVSRCQLARNINFVSSRPPKIDGKPSPAIMAR